MNATRGKLLAVVTRGGRALADIALVSGETRSRIELLMPYGMSALPTVGADLLVFQIGNRDHLVAIMADASAQRIPGLAPGEVGLRAFGQEVIIRADGVAIRNALQVTITTSGPVQVTAAGEVQVDAPAIRLGAGATVPVRLANNAAATKVFGV